MEPIRYVDALNRHYGAQGHGAYEWTVNTSVATTALTKPLNACTVSLLTSGGVSQCAMPAFDPDARNDHRLDAVHNSTPSDDFQIHDSYYNHADAEQDINCIFPIDRLRELVEQGTIGAVADRFWSGFMGRIYNRSKVIEDSAPKFADALQQDNVDILVAAPS